MNPANSDFDFFDAETASQGDFQILYQNNFDWDNGAFADNTMFSDLGQDGAGHHPADRTGTPGETNDLYNFNDHLQPHDTQYAFQMQPILNTAEALASDAGSTPSESGEFVDEAFDGSDPTQRAANVAGQDAAVKADTGGGHNRQTVVAEGAGHHATDAAVAPPDEMAPTGNDALLNSSSELWSDPKHLCFDPNFVLDPNFNFDDSGFCEEHLAPMVEFDTYPQVNNAVPFTNYPQANDIPSNNYPQAINIPTNNYQQLNGFSGNANVDAGHVDTPQTANFPGSASQYPGQAFTPAPHNNKVFRSLQIESSTERETPPVANNAYRGEERRPTLANNNAYGNASFNNNFNPHAIIPSTMNADMLPPSQKRVEQPQGILSPQMVPAVHQVVQQVDVDIELPTDLQELKLPFDPRTITIEELARCDPELLNTLWTKVNGLIDEFQYRPKITVANFPVDTGTAYPTFVGHFLDGESAKKYRTHVRHKAKDAIDLDRVKKHGRHFWVERIYNAMIDRSNVIDKSHSIHLARFNKLTGDKKKDKNKVYFEAKDVEASAHHVFDAALKVHEKGTWTRPNMYYKQAKRGALVDASGDRLEVRLEHICDLLRSSKAAVDDAIRGGVTLALLVDNPTARKATKVSNNKGNETRGGRLERERLRREKKKAKRKARKAAGLPPLPDAELDEEVNEEVIEEMGPEEDIEEDEEED